ncbi:MAG: hypothetical protein RL573_1248 [Actinomycetota bacterium]
MTVTVASLWLHGLPASASSMPSHVQTISVDTGFRVKRDGFSFANWSGLSKSTALSTKHMFQLLNEAGRCVDDGTNPTCTLRNGYVVDLAHLNEHLSQGRCEGMAVLAARIFLHKTRLTHVSTRADTTYDLTVNESADEIAYWWATQLAPNLQQVSAAHRAESVHVLAHEVLGRMRNKVMLTIGLYTKDTAHAVLAIRGVQRGNVTTFTVYDPNFPGQTRALVLDHNKDTWTYRNAQSPAGRLVTLSGKGAGGLDYVPISMRSTRSQWEFLGGF